MPIFRFRVSNKNVGGKNQTFVGKRECLNTLYIYTRAGDSSDSVTIISVTIMTVIAKTYYLDSGHVVTGHVNLTLSRLKKPTTTWLKKPTYHS